MCEDMGMDGMFVANVGMSCSIRNGDFIDPSDQKSLLPFRQDIEDAIEFALGDPATNEWAAKRAEMGHPEPFPLKYVELGNENGTARYSKRYGFFYDYLKNKYPDITFINTLTWWDNGLFGDYKKTDMLDVHWYVTPDEFYNDATIFENAYRGKTAGKNDFTIYAGEYAANNNVGQGNMDAALSEAAFVGAMERNSDFVTMASYAPLLTNVNQPNWSCNLIWYDNHQVMGRASYYVQTMYADNRPDYNVKTRIYSDGQTLMSQGKIGLGTWATSAKFRNLKVSSLDGNTTYYTSDFKTGLNDWSEFSGTWNVDDDGNYVQSSNGTPCLSFINAYAFRNCTFEVEAMKTGGAEGFLIAFGADTTNVNTHYRINIGGWSNTKTAVEKVVNGGSSVVSESVSQNLKNNQWYKIKVVMREGDGIYYYLDNKLILTYKTGDILNGRLQAFGGYDDAAGEMVIKVVNAKSEKLTANLHLNANGIESTGKVITLKAASLSDENSLSTPKKISPKESTFSGFANEFEYTFEPNSFTILRVKASKSAPTAITFPTYAYNDSPIPLAEASQKYNNAVNRLKALVAQAESNIIEGATGVDALKANIATSQEMLSNGSALTKELEEQCEVMQEAINTYFRGMMVSKNEQTSMIKNANFSTMNNSGWQGSAPALEHNVGEFWNTNFDSYQNLSGLENGYYLLYAQAFYRNGGQSEAFAAHNDGSEQLNAKLYAGSSSVDIRSLYDYQFSFGSWSNYCDNREQAEKAFNQSGDTYANYVIAEVTNGTLKIGVKKTKGVGADWTCFNNFRLFKIETDGSEPVEEETTVWCGNPILKTHYSADPAPMVYNDTFYIYYDRDLGLTPSGEVYFWMDEWRVASSTDMVNWTDHGTSLPLSAFKWAADGSAWASQCIERDGKFYWYTCADYPGHWHGIGVAVSDTPTGKFKDALGKPLISTGVLGDIDPTVFIDDDGQAYLYWGNNKLCYAKLNKNMTSIDKTIGNAGVVNVPLTKEGFGGLKVDGKVEGDNCFEEGPWIMKREGIYYLIYAAGGVPENIAYSTSSSPTGPWTYRGKIMPVTNTASFTNHCGVVKFKDNWYFVYHTGWLNEGNGGGGFNRSVAIEELHFNEDGSIQPIEPTRNGVKAIGKLNPYIWQSAATMNNGFGVSIEGNDEDGLYVTDINTLDSIAIANVDFGSEGAKSITLKYASPTSGAKMFVMQDKNRGGTRLAYFTIDPTESESDIREVTYDLTNIPSGTHRIIFYFQMGQNLRLYGWRFNHEDAETVGINNVKAENQVSPSLKGIYDLGGRKLASDSNLISKLPQGIYIIDGKKVKI